MHFYVFADFFRTGLSKKFLNMKKILLVSTFPYCGSRHCVVGSQRFLKLEIQSSEPTLIFGLGRSFVSFPGHCPHCSSSQDAVQSNGAPVSARQAIGIQVYCTMRIYYETLAQLLIL